MAKKHYSFHHEIPRSRGGRRVVELPKEFHSAWHVLFQNMMRDEIVSFIIDVNRIMLSQDKITLNDLHRLREKSKGGA